MPDPKLYVGCANGISTGMARKTAENAARQEARNDACSPGENAIMSGPMVGYMSEELAKTCESDPKNEACAHYQEFKEVLGEDKLPKGKQVCALFRADTVSCHPPGKSHEPATNATGTGSELAPPKDKDEAKARAKDVLDRLGEKIAAMGDDEQNEAISYIIEKVKLGYMPDKIVEMFNERF